MNLKGSKTEQNLMTAFAGESQARNKYTYFASVAKKEGYEQIASIFLETAENEKEHAKLWFKALGELGNTKENLLAAAQGENYEWTEMYLEFAKTAREEGFEALAKQFDIETAQVFAKAGVTVWVCRNCGHIHIGENAPTVCPVCAHPQSYFEVKATNY